MRSVSARLTLLPSALFAAVLIPLAASLYLWIREDLDRTFERDIEARLAIFQARFLEEYDEMRRGIQPGLEEPLREFLAAAGGTGHVRRADGSLLYAPPGQPGLPEGFRERSVTVAAPDGQSFVLTLAL